MVHALEKIHSLLKPTGFLINVHKFPQPLQVEVHCKGQVNIIGPFEHPSNFKNERLAMAALAKVVEDGLFVRDNELIYDFNLRANTLEELKVRRAEDWISAFLLDEIAIRVQDQMKMSGKEAQMVLRIKVWMARFQAN